MLELTEKQPLEEHEEGAQNGLKVVELELETEAGTELEEQLIPPAEEPVTEPIIPPSNTELPVPLKEDPAQNSQSDGHLTSQDMRRAKRIRVRGETLCFRSVRVSVAVICLKTMCLSPSMRGSFKDGCAGRWDGEDARETPSSKIPFVIFHGVNVHATFQDTPPSCTLHRINPPPPVSLQINVRKHSWKFPLSSSSLSLSRFCPRMQHCSTFSSGKASVLSSAHTVARPSGTKTSWTSICVSTAETPTPSPATSAARAS